VIDFNADVLIYICPRPAVVLVNIFDGTLSPAVVDVKYGVERYPSVPRPFTLDTSDGVEI
jgi:hypothetical protein